MPDDFVTNDSYDAYDADYEEEEQTWDEYCRELARESDDLTD